MTDRAFEVGDEVVIVLQEGLRGTILDGGKIVKRRKNGNLILDVRGHDQWRPNGEKAGRHFGFVRSVRLLHASDPLAARIQDADEREEITARICRRGEKLRRVAQECQLLDMDKLRAADRLLEELTAR